MPRKLTQEEFIQRVQSCVGNKYSVISEYQGKTKPVTLRCNLHNREFQAGAECFMRGVKDVRSSCPICAEENKEIRYANSRTEVECAYCGKKFIKSNSRLANSKSGMYFCCREHKDLANCLESGEKFEVIRPDHFGDSSKYRIKAFRSYPHQCAVCGYNENDDSLLDVHHIDSNRENNELENLIILCPTCHRKLTTHKYVLIDRNKIEKLV